MGLLHNQYSIVTNGLLTHFDPANGSSMISNKKNLLYLDETNSGNFYIANGSVSYDSTESAILWQNLGLFESWGTYMKNWSIFNTTLNTSKQYTASFEWKLEGYQTSAFSWEIVDDPGTSYVVSISLLNNSILQSNGWYKFTYTFTPANSGSNAYYRVITGTPTARSSFKLWWRKMQLEEGNIATTYASGVISTTLFDISGNNLHGTIVNPIYDSLNGGSLYMNGSTSYIDTGNRYLRNYNNGTIDIWTKSRDITFPSQHYFYEGSFGDGFGGEVEFHMTISNSVASAANTWFPSGGLASNGFLAGHTIYSSGTLSTNTWFNTTFTYSYNSDNTLCTIASYFNGVLANSGSIFPTRVFTGGNALLGRPEGYSHSTRSLRGSIGAFKFYNRVLSQSEITQNYNALKSRYGL